MNVNNSTVKYLKLKVPIVSINLFEEVFQTLNKPKGFRSEGRIIVDLDDQCKDISNFYEDN